MEILWYFVGLLVGVIGANITIKRNAGRGYFSVEPTNDPEDPGAYVVNIRVPAGQLLSQKSRIILKKKNSQK